jgi:acyl carrier protein
MPNIMTRSTFYAVLEDILQMPHGSLKKSDSRASIATWSSLADVQILTIVSSEFGIEPDAELIEAETVGDLVRLLEERNALS